MGEGAMAGADGFCLGAVASPNADLIELQMIRLDKKVSAGAGSSSVSRFMTWSGSTPGGPR